MHKDKHREFLLIASKLDTLIQDLQASISTQVNWQAMRHYDAIYEDIKRVVDDSKFGIISPSSGYLESHFDRLVAMFFKYPPPDTIKRLLSKAILLERYFANYLFFEHPEVAFRLWGSGKDKQHDKLNIHPNIQILMDRMDNALRRDDYTDVLHSSASIFETMAKDVVGIPAVQNQTLKSFFARYRRDSTLPDEVLDYILAIYESRNVIPLAGHGSTQTPNIPREAAISLAEMTKAFVRIEYKLREKSA